MKKTFIVTSVAGPNRDLSKGSREQQFWNEYGDFIDGLVEEGFILMGGPPVDEGGAVLIVSSEDDSEVRANVKHDPWYEHGLLTLESIKRWDIFIDKRV